MYSLETCPFCNIEEDGDQKILYENKTCLYIQKRSEQQILEGSGLIIPKLHKENLFELSIDEWSDTKDLLLKVKHMLDQTLTPDGYSVGWNTGEIGGQSIMHAHLHVIPRFKEEPHAGKGIRYWLKQSENRRDK